MGGGQLSLMGWLNREPVVFVATAGDRPAVLLFSSLFTPVVRGLGRVSYPRRRFLVPCTSLCLDLLPGRGRSKFVSCS